MSATEDTNANLDPEQLASSSLSPVGSAAAATNITTGACPSSSLAASPAVAVTGGTAATTVSVTTTGSGGGGGGTPLATSSAVGSSSSNTGSAGSSGPSVAGPSGEVAGRSGDQQSLEYHCRTLEDELQTVKESETKLKQQYAESQRRERILARRLAVKEQEMQDYASQIAELKTAQAPGPAALRSALLDPAVNIFFQKLKAELQSTKAKLEETQNELSAWKFTPDSNTGKRLMAKCRLLYQENEELGKMTSNGRLAKLESELALQKSYNEEVKKSQLELDDFLQELDEDVDGMQTTILYLQKELKKTTTVKEELEREVLQLRTYVNGGPSGADAMRTLASETAAGEQQTDGGGGAGTAAMYLVNGSSSSSSSCISKVKSSSSSDQDSLVYNRTHCGGNANSELRTTTASALQNGGEDLVNNEPEQQISGDGSGKSIITTTNTTGTTTTTTTTTTTGNDGDGIGGSGSSSSSSSSSSTTTTTATTTTTSSSSNINSSRISNLSNSTSGIGGSSSVSSVSCTGNSGNAKRTNSRAIRTVAKKRNYNDDNDADLLAGDLGGGIEEYGSTLGAAVERDPAVAAVASGHHPYGGDDGVANGKLLTSDPLDTTGNVVAITVPPLELANNSDETQQQQQQLPVNDLAVVAPKRMTRSGKGKTLTTGIISAIPVAAMMPAAVATTGATTTSTTISAISNKTTATVVMTSAAKKLRRSSVLSAEPMDEDMPEDSQLQQQQQQQQQAQQQQHLTSANGSN